MTEVGVLESFTFMHSAINLNSQHEQFLNRIQSSIDELKVLILILLENNNLSFYFFIEMVTKCMHRMESWRFSISWQCDRATNDS
jgi:hypothetical protein